MAMEAYFCERPLQAGCMVGERIQTDEWRCSLGNRFARVVPYDILDRVTNTLLQLLRTSGKRAVRGRTKDHLQYGPRLAGKSRAQIVKPRIVSSRNTLGRGCRE